jgi:hypothetical protein
MSRLEQGRPSFMAAELNERLNASEERLRKRLGASRVNALVREFKAAGKRQPGLFWTLYEQTDPYRWLADVWARKPRRSPSPYPTQPRQ